MAVAAQHFVSNLSTCTENRDHRINDLERARVQALIMLGAEQEMRNLITGLLISKLDALWLSRLYYRGFFPGVLPNVPISHKILLASVLNQPSR